MGGIRKFQPGDTAPETGTYALVTVGGQRLWASLRLYGGEAFPAFSSPTGMKLPVRYVLDEHDR